MSGDDPDQGGPKPERPPGSSGLSLPPVGPLTHATIGRRTRRDHCGCLTAKGRKGTLLVHKLHCDRQDPDAAGWRQLVDFVRLAQEKQLAIFDPSAQIPWDDWTQVITLPAAIGSLAHVNQFHLYGSHLRFLPPEIGQMTSLQNLDLYTSYSLHWLPYEVTRCRQLTDSHISHQHPRPLWQPKYTTAFSAAPRPRRHASPLHMQRL